ncbi:MAG: hypothetical protein AAGF12_29110 [Myxococcota bacterium]
MSRAAPTMAPQTRSSHIRELRPKPPSLPPPPPVAQKAKPSVPPPRIPLGPTPPLPGAPQPEPALEAPDTLCEDLETLESLASRDDVPFIEEDLLEDGEGLEEDPRQLVPQVSPSGREPSAGEDPALQDDVLEDLDALQPIEAWDLAESGDWNEVRHHGASVALRLAEVENGPEMEPEPASASDARPWPIENTQGVRPPNAQRLVGRMTESLAGLREKAVSHNAVEETFTNLRLTLSLEGRREARREFDKMWIAGIRAVVHLLRGAADRLSRLLPSGEITRS